MKRYCPCCDSEYPMRYDAEARVFYCLDCEYVTAPRTKRAKRVKRAKPLIPA